MISFPIVQETPAVTSILPFLFLVLFTAFAILRAIRSRLTRQADRQEGGDRADHEGLASRLIRSGLIIALASTVVIYGFYHTFDLFLWMGRFDLSLPAALRWLAVFGSVASLIGLNHVYRALGPLFSARLELK